MTGRRGATIAAAAVALTLLGLATARLAPPALGGRTTWMLVGDRSMEPALHPGDLALFRPAAPYAAGDVVAVDRDGRLAVLRVVTEQDGRLALRADALDTTEPTPASREVITGRLVAAIPVAGRVLAWIGAPAHASLVAGSAAAAALLALLAGRQRRRGVPAAAAAPLVVSVIGRLDVAAGVVDVVSYESLEAVALHHDAVILEEHDGDRCRYFVDGRSAVFRFCPPGSEPAAVTASAALGLPGRFAPAPEPHR